MAKCLVTGAAGFMGSHLVDYLLEQGHDVYGIDNLSGGFLQNVNPDSKFKVLDLRNYTLLEEYFDNIKPEYIFHLAAYAAEGLSPWIRRFNYANNQMASINLVNLAIRHGVKHFVFTSSMAVYGDLADKGGVMTEESPTNPIDPYGISKLAVEYDLKAAFEVFGLPYTIFRPHNVYGPRQNVVDPHRNVIGIFLRENARGNAVKVFGNGKQTRAFTYIHDIIPIIGSAPSQIGAINQTFNIGADKTHSILELIEHLGIKEFEHVEGRHEAQQTNPSHEKISKIFPKVDTPLGLGLIATKKWFEKDSAYMYNAYLTSPIREL